MNLSVQEMSMNEMNIINGGRTKYALGDSTAARVAGFVTYVMLSPFLFTSDVSYTVRKHKDSYGREIGMAFAKDLFVGW